LLYFAKSVLAFESSASWNIALSNLDLAGIGWLSYLACSRNSTCCCDFCYTGSTNASGFADVWVIVSDTPFNSSADSQNYCDQASGIIQMNVNAIVGPTNAIYCCPYDLARF
jgi:hypothetical protein